MTTSIPLLILTTTVLPHSNVSKSLENLRYLTMTDKGSIAISILPFRSA
jgi:hypothetical protein